MALDLQQLTDSFLDRYRLAALIQALEDDLRSMIRQYVAPYVAPEHAFGEKLEELRRRAGADGVLDAGFDTLVDYIDFGDAFALLNRHRGMLPDAFANTVRVRTPAFEVAAPIRNRVMHGRPLLSDDEEQIARLGGGVVGDPAFPLTSGIARHLVEDPAWSPLIEIDSTPYGRVLHNLPLPEFDETGLLGREEELRRVRELLLRQRYPVVTVAGEGGIGKTALAVQVLYDLVDSPECPFDAVLWTSLKTERLTGRGVQQIRAAATDMLSIAGSLTGAIGDEEQTDVGVLAEVLEGTRCLIAIDNVETIAAAELLEFIEAISDAQFLLTSRVGLGEIERRVTLGALGSNAAKVMLRQLASRRGLLQLARVSDKQADRIIEQLRRSPLAVRWFIEAVQAGGQPDDLLRDQSAVLQFCMSTIYDSLEPAGRQLVDCLLALDDTATVGQLALLTGLERDEVLEEIYELQRRAVVQVDSRLSESLTQSYALSAMAREYLRRFGSLDVATSERIQSQLREIAATDELIRQYDHTVALEPMAIAVDTAEERAVANVLRQALRKSKHRDIEGALKEVARARDAVPSFFETYRVNAFIESDRRPAEARRLYEEAYRLAPPSGRPKVAYWLAGHLMNMLAAAEAEPYAREAHEGLRLPGTALRLGRVCMYEGQRFDEAEELLREATSAENAKTRMIAETMLVDLAKRRVEKAAEEDKLPQAALNVARSAIERADSVLASGVIDRRYEEELADLVSEALLVALRLPDVSAVVDELSEILEAIDRNFRVLSRPGLRDGWSSRLGRLCSHGLCPDELVLYGKKIEARLEKRLVLTRAGRHSGDVLEFSAAKRYGFIKPHEGGDNIFFHESGVHDSGDLLFFSRGAEVNYATREVMHNGELRLRAEEITVVASEAARERRLRERRGLVVHKGDAYLFVEDTATQVRIYVPRSAFPSEAEWRRISSGEALVLDVELGERGPRAVSGTVRAEPLSTPLQF